MKIKILLLCITLVFICSFAHSQDFGLLINQYAGLASPKKEIDDFDFEYRTWAIPRFSLFIDDTKSFYVSAAVTLTYNYNEDELYIVPELLRTEFAMNQGMLRFKAGRINYSDPLAFVANGLFDGVQATYATPMGRFSAGAWYTGLLYKETLEINMTSRDIAVNSVPFDYDDFTDTYFTSKRLLFSLDWEHPSVADLFRLKIAIAGQMDLNDFTQSHAVEYEKVNSQYFILKADIPVNRIHFELGGCFSLMQYLYDDFKDQFGFAIAGELGVTWIIPSSFNSKLAFKAFYTGATMNETFHSFVPVTTHYFGEIFRARMTGITSFGLNYTARFAQPLALSINANYFVRNDLITTNNYPLLSAGEDGYYLGPEAFLRIIWNPVSDLQLNMGAGVFVPSLGDRWQDEDPIWKASLMLILALF